VFTNLEFRVLHLSSSHTGGAGIAARRLSAGLNHKGVNSVFLTLENAEFTPGSNEVSYPRSSWEKLPSKLNTLVAKKLMKSTYFSIFSVPTIKINDLMKIGSPKNTILHVHNWFNLLSAKSIERLLRMGYQIVFTLHDQRLFTGGCHYSLHCTKYLHNCASCPFLPAGLKNLPERNKRKMRALLDTYKKQITIIGPSNWVVEKAKSSEMFRDIDVIQLLNYHGVLDKRVHSARQITEKKNSNLVIGVASFDKNSVFKGGKTIAEVQRRLLAQNSQIKIVYLADIVDSDTKYLEFWAQIDYLLVLSVADNSPNVIHEAKFFGIPIIGSNVGGIPELLDPNFDYIIENNSNQILALEVLLKSIESNFVYIDPLTIKNRYDRHSALDLQKLINLYKKIYSRIIV
jgi:glycosyltransferase involved in cell wall biosynthesis